ncbi:Mce protein [Mycobacterium sp. C31M]
MSTAEENTVSTSTDVEEELVESDETTDETPEAEVDTEAVEPAPRRRRLLVGVVAVVLVALLGLSGFLGWQLWQSRQVAAAGQQARDAAVSYAQVLTSIDSNKVDENFDQVLAGATGEFKDMYSESSMQLRQLLIDNKASAHGVVIDSAVQSATKDTVVVLLFVDQSVSNAQVPDPRIDRSRIKMTMQKVDGQWRAAKVELP